MLLTSQIKELGAILQKLIKPFYQPGFLLVENETKWTGVDGNADEPLSWDFGRGLGATTETIRQRNVLSQELEQWEKKAVLNSVG
jgi:hypothetical protein